MDPSFPSSPKRTPASAPDHPYVLRKKTKNTRRGTMSNTENLRFEPLATFFDTLRERRLRLASEGRPSRNSAKSSGSTCSGRQRLFGQGTAAQAGSPGPIRNFTKQLKMQSKPGPILCKYVPHCVPPLQL